jgi:RNA polymerase sigma factor (sigma-70 family)
LDIFQSGFFVPFCQVPSEKRNKQPLPVGIKSEREIGTSFISSIWNRKEVNSMERSSSNNKGKTVQHQFDSFCRKVLKGEASNYRKALARRWQYEVTFSELSEKELNQLYAMDEYAIDYYLFQVMGYDVEVKDALIGEALEALPEKKRNIILLSYFMDMSDAEIGELMNLVRTTIYRHRTSSLQQIKKYMEGKADDENKSEP